MTAPPKALVFALLASLSAGCVPKRMEIVMPSWRGHHFSEVFASWGAPQAAYEDGRGGRIIIWTDTIRTIMPSKATATAGMAARDLATELWRGFDTKATYSPEMTNSYDAFQMFHFDSKGYVRGWDWQEKAVTASSQSRRPYCPPGMPLCPVK